MQAFSCFSCSGSEIKALASFANLGTIRANLRNAANNSVAQIGISGERYYQIEIDVVAYFGSTELTAQMAWKENVSHGRHFSSLFLIDAVFPGDRKAVSFDTFDFSRGITWTQNPGDYRLL